MRRVMLFRVSMVIVMVCVRILVEALLAMKYQEVQTEGIEGSYKHACQYRKLCKASGWQMALVHRLNNAVLGIETGEQRRSNERK